MSGAAVGSGATGGARPAASSPPLATWRSTRARAPTSPSATTRCRSGSARRTGCSPRSLLGELVVPDLSVLVGTDRGPSGQVRRPRPATPKAPGSLRGPSVQRGYDGSDVVVELEPHERCRTSRSTSGDGGLTCTNADLGDRLGMAQFDLKRISCGITAVFAARSAKL